MKRTVFATVLILLAVGLQQFALFPINNGFTTSLTNWLHVPMFTVITASLLWLRPGIRLPVLLTLVTGLAVLSEGLQWFSERQPSIEDLFRDFIGCGVALFFLYRPAPGWTTNGSSVHRKDIAGTIIVTALITLAWPTTYLAAYDYQKRIFPVLYQPGDLRGGVLTETRSARDRAVRTSRLHTWSDYAGQPVLEITWADARWPGVHLHEPIGDWQGYEYLTVDVFNAESTPQRFTAAVRHMHREGTARYSSCSIAPGPNRLRIPLEHLALLDNAEPATITHVILHTTREHAGQRVLLGRVWLDSSGGMHNTNCADNSA